jgi:hypothetical protein
MPNKTLAGLGIGLFSLLTVLPLHAQEVATLAMKNGERPSGELLDMNAGGFILRIGGQERAFPSNDVQAVEFVVGPLSAEAQAKVNAGQPFVILRSGQLVDGRLVDVGGRRPLRLTIDAGGGRRDFSSSDVAQVWVNPTARAGAQNAAQAQATGVPAGAITVPANAFWTDTGVVVNRNTTLTIHGTGDIMLSAGASSGVGGSPAATVPGIKYPLQGAPAGALIGRIGNGSPFLIGGAAQPMTFKQRGTLMLGVNDDVVADNSGNFYVTITR